MLSVNMSMLFENVFPETLTGEDGTSFLGVHVWVSGSSTFSFFSSSPVAMTVTLIWSSISGSITAPRIILESSCALSCISDAASWTWSRVTLSPPVILIRMPRAPSIDDFSRSGFRIAFFAASKAPPSPLPIPMPITAFPCFCMIAFMSAKSRFISPGTRIRSEMP